MLESPKFSNQTSQQPLKLCGPGPLSMSPTVGPQKDIWGPFSTWELPGAFLVGIWVLEATKRNIFQSSKQDAAAKVLWPAQKQGGFGRWENPEKKCPKMVRQILQRGLTEASRPKHLPIFWTSTLGSSRQTRVPRFGEGSWESRFGVWRPVGKGEKSYPFVEQDHWSL